MKKVILAAAGFVEARHDGKTLQQRRFSGAVLTDDDGDGAIEREREIVLQKRQAERIGFAIRNERWLDPYPPEIRCWQIDVAISP